MLRENYGKAIVCHIFCKLRACVRACVCACVRVSVNVRLQSGMTNFTWKNPEVCLVCELWLSLLYYRHENSIISSDTHLHAYALLMFEHTHVSIFICRVTCIESYLVVNNC